VTQSQAAAVASSNGRLSLGIGVGTVVGLVAGGIIAGIVYLMLRKPALAVNQAEAAHYDAVL
jgi:uncharacterized membrane protein YciS (DUF1049 family)